MQVTSRAFGGAIAAFGVSRLIWDFGATRSLYSGHVPKRWFIYILPVALVGWLLMRWWTPGGTRPTAQKLWDTARQTLLALALLLPACSLAASGGITKHGAYMTELRVDLRHLAGAQEAFHKDSGFYSASFERLGYKPSSGVNAPTISAGPRAWSAINSHRMLADTRCAIAVGTTNPITGSVEQDIACAPLTMPLDKPSVAFDILLIVLGIAIGIFL